MLPTQGKGRSRELQSHVQEQTRDGLLAALAEYLLINTSYCVILKSGIKENPNKTKTIISKLGCLDHLNRFQQSSPPYNLLKQSRGWNLGIFPQSSPVNIADAINVSFVYHFLYREFLPQAKDNFDILNFQNLFFSDCIFEQKQAQAKNYTW